MKMDEETRALGQLMAHNFGLVVVVLQGPMSTLSWNSRGLGNRPTVLALKRALRVEAPKFVFLIKTKLSSDSMYLLKTKLGYSQGVAVSSVGSNGRLALLWKPESTVEIKGILRWYIDVVVSSYSNGDI